MSTITELLYPKSLRDLVDDETREERDGCIVPRMLWTKWTRSQTAEVLLVELKQRDVKHLLVVESHHSQDVNDIYIPERCRMDFDADEYVLVKVIAEMPPVATKIVLQPLDNELYHCDIATAVSEHLSKWNILTKNVTLTVPLQELGGFLVDIFVKDIEPAETVLLRGEVPLELAESLETVQEWTAPVGPQRPPTPVAKGPEPLANPIFTAGESMIPEMTTYGEDKQETRYLPPPKRSRNEPMVNTFVPFSGAGRRLGDP